MGQPAAGPTGTTSRSTARCGSVCAVGFDVLGATELRSIAFVDNPASLAVSRKVGYRTDGTFVADREGVAATRQGLLLRPEWLVRADQPVEFSGTEPLLRFLGLTPAP